MTTALEEMTINNEQLRREVDVLTTDITQLRTDNDAMKDEIIQLQGTTNKHKDEIIQLQSKQKDEIIQLQAKQKDEIRQLTTLLDKMAVNNQNQIQQINSQSNEIVQLRTEVQQLTVSQLVVRDRERFGKFTLFEPLVGEGVNQPTDY